MACETCKYMNEPETGPHCSICSEAYSSEYEPMTNRDILKQYNNAELAVVIVNKPWCDPIMGDMTCDTVGRCRECVEKWLNDRGGEGEEDASIQSASPRE